MSEVIEKSGIADEEDNLPDIERFMAVAEDGSVSTFETIVTFYVEETGDNFIVFTEDGALEGEEVEAMAALFDPNEIVEGVTDLALLTLYPIEDEEKMALVEAVLQDMSEEE